MGRLSCSQYEPWVNTVYFFDALLTEIDLGVSRAILRDNMVNSFSPPILFRLCCARAIFSITDEWIGITPPASTRHLKRSIKYLDALYGTVTHNREVSTERRIQGV